MWRFFSLELLSSVSSGEVAMYVGAALLFGVLLGFWLGTYLVISKEPEAESLAEDYTYYRPRKPTMTPAERKERERRDLL